MLLMLLLLKSLASHYYTDSLDKLIPLKDSDSCVEHEQGLRKEAQILYEQYFDLSSRETLVCVNWNNLKVIRHHWEEKKLLLES